jgi:uncharacterized repeat protein (TIGR03847 family)
VSESFDLGDVAVFTAGAVGPPGQRTFYLQARTGQSSVAWKVEKQQVAALGEFLQRMLSDLPQPDAVPDESTVALVEPVEAQWPVGSLGVAYDGDEDRILVAADELVETDEEGNPAPGVDQATARVRITRAQALAFVATAERLMEGGRPPCPLCGRPMNPDGHICPRTNGHAIN